MFNPYSMRTLPSCGPCHPAGLQGVQLLKASSETSDHPKLASAASSEARQISHCCIGAVPGATVGLLLGRVEAQWGF